MLFQTPRKLQAKYLLHRGKPSFRLEADRRPPFLSEREDPHEYTLGSPATCTTTPHSMPSPTAEELFFQLFVNRFTAEPNFEIGGREVRSFNAEPGAAVQLQVGA